MFVAHPEVFGPNDPYRGKPRPLIILAIEASLWSCLDIMRLIDTAEFNLVSGKYSLAQSQHFIKRKENDIRQHTDILNRVLPQYSVAHRLYLEQVIFSIIAGEFYIMEMSDYIHNRECHSGFSDFDEQTLIYTRRMRRIDFFRELLAAVREPHAGELDRVRDTEIRHKESCGGQVERPRKEFSDLTDNVSTYIRTVLYQTDSDYETEGPCYSRCYIRHWGVSSVYGRRFDYALKLDRGLERRYSVDERVDAESAAKFAPLVDELNRALRDLEERRSYRGDNLRARQCPRHHPRVDWST